MPYVFMIVAAIIMLAAYVFPIKWILETQEANGYEKAFFILLTIPVSIFSYYLFFAYLRYFKYKQ